MNRRHFLAAGAASAVSACVDIPTETFSYRLKIVLDDNGVERSGASVIKVRWNNASKVPMSYTGGYSSNVWGEAPVVDLGSRGLLFALLANTAFDGPTGFSASFTPVARLCADEGTWNQQSQFSNFKPDFWTAVESVRGKTGEHDLWSMHMPPLARFEDITKPASVVEVTPDRFAEAYGMGVSLLRASIEVTEEPPTERILGILPWLPETEFFTTTRLIEKNSSFAERTRRGHFRRWG